jgi:hypothetical protein
MRVADICSPRHANVPARTATIALFLSTQTSGSYTNNQKLPRLAQFFSLESLLTARLAAGAAQKNPVGDSKINAWPFWAIG